MSDNKIRPAILIQAQPGSHVVGNIETVNVTIERDGRFVMQKPEQQTDVQDTEDLGMDLNVENYEEFSPQVDEVMYENHVFTHKYASYAKMKQLREQIRKCLATDDKEETANLIDPAEKVQWVIVYGLLVVYKMIEDKKGAPTKFLRQMHTFFPDLVPEPDERWMKSLSAELKLWRDPSGTFLPFGQWSMNCNIYQKNKRRRVTAIAQHIKPFIVEAI